MSEQEAKVAAVVGRARKFWKVASTFPPNKEDVYPEHTKAQEFDALPSNSLVLEYGCGGGSDAMSFLRRGHRVVACDINPSNIASTGARIREADALRFHERYATWMLLKSDEIRPFRLTSGGSPTLNDAPPQEVLNNLGLDDSGKVVEGSFDVASSHGVLHHIPEPVVSRVVASIFRMLKPGGKFYAMLYTPRLESEHAAAMTALIKQYSISHEEAFGWMTDGEGCPWAEAYNDARARKLFEGAGFEVLNSFDYHEGFFRTYRMVKPEKKKRS